MLRIFCRYCGCLLHELAPYYIYLSSLSIHKTWAVWNRYQISFSGQCTPKMLISAIVIRYLWKLENGINTSTLWPRGDESAECLADGQDFETCQTHRKGRYESIEIVWGTQLRQPEIRVFLSQMHDYDLFFPQIALAIGVLTSSRPECRPRCRVMCVYGWGFADFDSFFWGPAPRFVKEC